ncbi:Hsp20/alpha crystallin family protein [Flavisolibacter nicotianae]|uniref:Hsp20/alpha crystallin family protein n=1 Tax=Flavisolibacter nicotianae TaxID=2364882 RepID=UPI000EAD9877|nr:Hsp20/alpha crystallin family protein [Flavisolibacter nicotianae]
MTVVRYKNRINGEPAFNNLLSDLFTPFPSLNRDEFKQAVPVNIRETEKEYFLDIVAPGLAKEDFKIDIENNLLTVSAEKKEENADANQTFVRREYRHNAFKRSFTLDEKIDTEAISAQYVNGFLTVNLPKKAEVKPAVKQISVQ